jgi:AcrR family transcriptional regulator
MAKQRRLDREQVVAKAAALADAAGDVQAVSITCLAAALDIRAPSLYNHIASLEDLHEALALYATQRLSACLHSAVGGQSGQEALMTMALAYRRFAQEHPGIYPLTLRAPAHGNTPLLVLAQELLQMLYLIFASFGVRGDDAIHAVRGLRALLHGFTTLEAVEAFKMPIDLDESFRRLITTYLAGLAAEEGKG